MMSHAGYLIHKVLTSFAERSSPSYSWHSVSTDRFLENCSIELLRIDDSMAYRIGYEQIKKLSKVLRANCISKYHVDDDNEETSLKRKRGSLENGYEQKSGPERKKQEVVDWSFIRAIRLWTRVVSSSPGLRRLAYSLSMVISGAMKVKLTDLKYFPFVFHCLSCLNRLAASLEAFIPITSYLLSLTATLLHAAAEAKRQSKHGAELGSTKPKKLEVEILLCFRRRELLETSSLEPIGDGIYLLLVDHLGLLGQSPAFPELVQPVLLQLKFFCKHCPWESLRGKLKKIVVTIEESAKQVHIRREALSEVSWKQLLTLAPDSAISKSRTVLLHQRTSQEKVCIDAAKSEKVRNNHK